MENTILLPALFGDVDADIQAAARALEEDLNHLNARLREYGHHWASAEIICRAPEAFIRNSLELFRALRHRIQVEATGLFPLVERT
jgi:hypothetical protein